MYFIVNRARASLLGSTDVSELHVYIHAELTGAMILLWADPFCVHVAHWIYAHTVSTNMHAKRCEKLMFRRLFSKFFQVE